MRRPLFNRIWGEANLSFHRSLKLGGVDLLIVGGLAGALFGLIDLGREWTVAHRPAVEIDLSPWALPRYTFFSLMRGLLAYVFSLLFTLTYGYWAAKDPLARRVLVPLLDVLQSIPVLGFLPGVVLALVALFPSNNVGLELAAVLMIFTGQAWNMTFSFYQSVRHVPDDLREVAAVYRFGWWQTFSELELPYATMGLVWNSMMSMAGGWFFLMISESFQLGDNDYRLAGVGSYMSKAVEAGDVPAQLWAVLAMTVMIVALDQLLWRPVVVWAQKFRVEEGGSQEAARSWFLDWLRRSRLFAFARRSLGRLFRSHRTASSPLEPDTFQPDHQPGFAGQILVKCLFLTLIGLLGTGLYRLFLLVEEVSLAQWAHLLLDAGLTLGRVILAVAIGTLWTLPAGLAIGLSPRLSRLVQPAVQVVASFPAPLLFPLVVAGMTAFGVTLDWGSIVLLLLGTQWYILFNVIAGGMAVPADLREAARSYRLTLWQRFRVLYFPAVFPYLVTGWVTAAGGAWNASIIAEYFKLREQVLKAHGLGAAISEAAAEPNFPVLAASVIVMSVVVVLFNSTVWRGCYRLAETRFAATR